MVLCSLADNRFQRANGEKVSVKQDFDIRKESGDRNVLVGYDRNKVFKESSSLKMWNIWIR